MRTREAWVLPRAGLADAGLEMSRQEEEVDGTTDKPSGEGQVTVLDYCCDVERSWRGHRHTPGVVCARVHELESQREG